jgi:hypothetical protein
MRKYNLVKDVKAGSQRKQNNNNSSNSKLFKQIIKAIYSIIKQRTSKNYSTMIINDILKNMENKYNFLKYIKLNKTGQPKDNHELINILQEIDKIDQKEIGRAIESIIRVASINMKDIDAGLDFITELKDKINNKYISELKNHGVDIDLIQEEQHNLNKQRKMKIALPNNYKRKQSKDKKHSNFASLINVAWEKVAFWEYNDNICTIYDKKGNILDRLPLDKIVKDYILELNGFNELPLNSEKIVELNEKEYEFIKILYSKDMNTEDVIKLLKITSGELSIIIRKLLVYEIMQYISYDKLMLTENTVKTIASK